MTKCTNCKWEGEDKVKLCPICGDNTDLKGSEPSKQKLNMDLNNDGVIDKKDRSIAAKVLSSGRKKSNRGKR